jgi:beta-N-acetylhexosaminidase
LTERRGTQAGQSLSDEFRRRAPKYRQMLLDPTLPESALDELAREAASCESIVVTAFVTVSAYRGDVALPGGFAPFLTKLTEGRAPVTLVSLGNPYLLRSFPKAAAYLATFSPSQPSELSAVKALFGEMDITGRTPVTIPGFARYGDGIQLRASSGGQ